MRDDSGTPALYTIGHSNQSGEELVALLGAHGIGQVVDVRSVPFSRWTPQFNREALERMVAAHGIAYAFAGDYLGGRPTDPGCFYDGVVPEGEADYLSLVDYAEVARRPWYQRGLSRLLELADALPTAVMCSEEDPLRCHRHHLIAQTLLAQGRSVWHIRRGGALEPATAPPTQLSLLP